MMNSLLIIRKLTVTISFLLRFLFSIHPSMYASIHSSMCLYSDKGKHASTRGSIHPCIHNQTVYTGQVAGGRGVGGWSCKMFFFLLLIMCVCLWGREFSPCQESGVGLRGLPELSILLLISPSCTYEQPSHHKPGPLAGLLGMISHALSRFCFLVPKKSCLLALLW